MVPKTVPLIPAALPSSVSTCIAGANFSLTLITTSLKVNDLPSGDSILTETKSPFLLHILQQKLDQGEHVF